MHFQRVNDHIVDVNDMIRTGKIGRNPVQMDDHFVDTDEMVANYHRLVAGNRDNRMKGAGRE